MTVADLDKLERDVAQAPRPLRRRSDTAALSGELCPVARFKDDLWAEARETKDDLVDKAREAAEDGAQRVLTELKERAAANPLAAAAIGAGLGVAFHSPPADCDAADRAGLFGLLRTPAPQHNGEPYGPP